MNYWLLKSEPGTYSWEDMQKDKTTCWDGVRNYQARNNMKAMKKGDLCFFYHSVGDREIVGIVEVVKETYEDHTFTPQKGKQNPWQMVDVKAVKTVPKIINLDQIKANPKLAEMALVKQSRLSVSPVRQAEWQEILNMMEKSA